MENKHIEIRHRIPIPQLSDFVESYWMIINHSETAHEIVVLPDARFDIIFSYSETIQYHAAMMGLGTEPGKAVIPGKSVMFAISFNLLAIEYLLDVKAASLLNNAYPLPYDFWGITKDDLDDFEKFCNKASEKMRLLIKPEIDERKRKLFELIYASNGTLSVKELSEQTFWNSRQINRYFNEQFGIPLKAYCNILRFKVSLAHLKDGKLFPELDYTDQNHFIKEVKRFSGVVPKTLSQNQNDRFILLSALPKK
jgi:AraC-like DNA-binding protein